MLTLKLEHIFEMCLIVKSFEITSFLEALNIMLCVIKPQVVIINKIFEV